MTSETGIAASIPVSWARSLDNRALASALDRVRRHAYGHYGRAERRALLAESARRLRETAALPPLKSVAAIVAYNWDGEEADYGQCGDNGNSREGHVYEDLVLVRQWLARVARENS